MAVIVVKEFGGEQPSISPRNLPGNTGQAAKNLTNSTNEFLPLHDALVVATTDSVINPGSVVINPKSLFRTAFLANGAPNTSLTTGWLTNAGEVNWVRGQINEADTERVYYTGPSGPRKFSWVGGALVDRPMGVPAPTAAPTVTPLVVDELRTSELEVAAKDSITLIENTLFEQSVAGLDGCDLTFPAASASSFGWAAHPSDPARRYLHVPFVDGAIKEGFEFMLDPRYGGVKTTVSSVDYLQMDWTLFGRTWGYNPAALKTALLALPSPAAGVASLLTDADADLVVTRAQAYFSPTVAPRAAMIATAKEQTNAVQRALQSVQDGGLKTSFYNSTAYKNDLLTLIGAGGAVEGTVTNAILNRIFVTTANSAWGEPGNVPDEFIANPTRYWQPDGPAFGGWTASEGRTLIRADLVASIKTRDDGVRWFDNSAMETFLRTEFEAILSQRSAASQNFYRPQIEGWISEALAPMRAFFDPEVQAALSAGLVGGGSLAVSFAALVDSAGAALQRITDTYTALRNEVKTLARTIYDAPDVSTRSAQRGAAVTPIVDTRFYIATYVTDWGEESAPSPVSEKIEVDQNDQVTVTIAPPVGRPDIIKWRLYRSNVGSESAAYQGLHEGALYTGASPLTFLDVFTSADLQEVCPTLTWLEPEATMRGLVGMPNGVMAGHFGNTLAFCEPFAPYAWPIQYQITVESQVVGLAVFGQTLFVGTKANPYFVSGSDSASMSALKLESSQACVSSRSIVALEGGVIYASPDGLCLADGAGVKLITRGIWNTADWRALQPQTVFAASHEGAYVFATNSGTRMFVFGDGKVTELDLEGSTVSALYADKLSGTLCSASGGSVTASFGSTLRRTARWKSPRVTLASPQPMAWAQVFGDQSVAFPATLRWYGDGALRHTMTFTDLTPQRLPAGRYLEHEVEVESKARLTRLVVASTSDELKGV